MRAVIILRARTLVDVDLPMLVGEVVRAGRSFGKVRDRFVSVPLGAPRTISEAIVRTSRRTTHHGGK